MIDISRFFIGTENNVLMANTGPVVPVARGPSLVGADVPVKRLRAGGLRL